MRLPGVFTIRCSSLLPLCRVSAVLLLMAATCVAQAPVPDGHALWSSTNLVQHDVGLRHPQFGYLLRYDSTGNPIGNRNPAPLTNGGFLHVNSVSIEGSRIKVKGNRVLLTGKACDKGLLTPEGVEIVIEASKADNESASNALSAVFLSNEELANRLHSYYQDGAADAHGRIGTLDGTQPVFLVGHGTTAPWVYHSVDADSTDAARRAQKRGTVVLSVVVDQNGIPQVIAVARSLGLGLDESAEYAVSQWRFHPAMRDGKPVAMRVNIESWRGSGRVRCF